MDLRTFRRFRPRAGRAAAGLAACLIASTALLPVVVGPVGAAPQQGQDMTLADVLAGKTLPLTRKLGELNGDWRRVRLQRANVSDSLSGIMSAAMMGAMGALGGGEPAAFTRGETVRVEGKSYLVLYVHKPALPDFATLRNAGSLEGLTVPPQPLTRDTPLRLSLVSLTSIRSVDGIEPFDLQAELAGVPSGSVPGVFEQARATAQNTASLSNLKQIGLAAMMYAQDYDEMFPPMKSAAQTRKLLMPYVKNEDVFKHPASGKQYVPNPFVSGKSFAVIERPADLVIYYEPETASDGTRGAAFADGHAKRLAEVAWRRAAAYSKIAAPLPVSPPRAAAPPPPPPAKPAP